jgi:hypothetical protein
VPPFKPVILLVNVPVPPPSVVLFSVIVGEMPVLQQTPLAIIVPEPSEVIVPPEVAVVPVIFDIAEVVNVGAASFLHEWKITVRMNKLKIVILIIDFMNDYI